MTINVVVFWSVLGASIIFLYGPWQVFWANWFRQEAFATRDTLFDMALKKQVSFNDPEYLQARATVNALIRMADELTWTHLLFLFVVNKGMLHKQSKEISYSDPYKRVITSTMKALLISVVMRAPALWPLIVLMLGLQLWNIGARGLADVTNSIMFVRISQSATRALTVISA